MEVLQPDLFIGARSKKPVDISLTVIDGDTPVEHVFIGKLNGEGRKSRGDEETLGAVQDSFEKAVQVIMGGNLVFAVFMSGLMQYMWGMINALQIAVLTVLFSCT